MKVVCVGKNIMVWGDGTYALKPIKDIGSYIIQGLKKPSFKQCFIVLRKKRGLRIQASLPDFLISNCLDVCDAHLNLIPKQCFHKVQPTGQQVPCNSNTVNRFFSLFKKISLFLLSKCRLKGWISEWVCICAMCATNCLAKNLPKSKGALKLRKQWICANKRLQSLLWTLIQKDAQANTDLIEGNGTTCFHLSTRLGTLLCKVLWSTWTQACRAALQELETAFSAGCPITFWFVHQIKRFLFPFVLHMLLAQEKYLLDFCSLVWSGRGCVVLPPKQYREEGSLLQQTAF